MYIFVQWLTFREIAVSFWQVSLVCTDLLGFSQGSQILEAIIVTSISNKIFSNGGSFTLKLEVPLKVTIFGAGLLPSAGCNRDSLNSIETFTASQVNTLDWNIKKSEISKLNFKDGISSRTQIEFFSEECSMQYSMCIRGLLNSIGFTSSDIEFVLLSGEIRKDQNGYFSTSLS